MNVINTAEMRMISVSKKGLLYLYLATACEKLGFNAIRYMLVLYLVKYMVYTDEMAYSINGSLLVLMHLSCMIGGWIGNHFVTNHKAAQIGSLLLCFGIFILLFPLETAFFLGLGFIACGEGYLRANLPALLSKIYKNSVQYDSVFTLYYVVVNIGALLSIFCCCVIAEVIGWKYGFISAALISLLSFVFLNKGAPYLDDSEECFGKAGQKNVYKLLFASLLLSLLWAILIYTTFLICYVLMILSLISVIIIFYIHPTIKDGLEVLCCMLISVFFFALYEQGPSSINLFIDRAVDRTVFNTFTLPATLFQFLDGFLNILLGVILYFSWLKVDTFKFNITAFKLALGLLFLGMSFYVLSSSVYYVTQDGLVPIYIILLAYLFLILGEQLIVPVSMSFISKKSPKKYTSLMLGIWNVSVSVGHLLSSLIAKETSIDVSIITSSMAIIENYCTVFSKMAKVSLMAELLVFSYLLYKFYQYGRKYIDRLKQIKPKGALVYKT